MFLFLDLVLLLLCEQRAAARRHVDTRFFDIVFFFGLAIREPTHTRFWTQALNPILMIATCNRVRKKRKQTIQI